MKITMPLKQLKDAIENSSAGALTKDAQDEERKKTKPTDSCVNITATKDLIVFESSSPKLSAQYSMLTNESIIVDQEGICCFEASAYLKLLNTLSKGSLIEITQEDNKDYAKDAFGGIIQPNGILTTRAIKNEKEKRRCNHDTFPVDGFTQVDYKHKKVLFSIQAKLLTKCVDEIMFATDPKDYENVYNHVAIYDSDNKIYFVGSDSFGFAFYSVIANEKDAAIILDNHKLFIEGKLLKRACQSFDNNEVVDVIDCEDGGHVILASVNTKVRLPVAKLDLSKAINTLNLAYPTSIVADKADLIEAVKVLSFYNPERLVFYIKKGKSEITIETANRGDDPENAIVECEPITTSLTKPIILNNAFILDGCENIVGNKVKISFTADEQRIRMESTKDTRFVYIFPSCVQDKDPNTE